MAVADQPPGKHNLAFKIYNPFADFETVRALWLAMLDQSAHGFFTSWGWISTWLNSLPETSNVRLVVGYHGEEAVEALFVGGAARRRYRFLPSKILSLNSTGNPYYDKLYIEDNSILLKPGASFRPGEILGFLDFFAWDEFHLPGASGDFMGQPGLFGRRRGVGLLVDEAADAHFVRLEKIREANMDYYKLLSANKRSQIRRSIKQYELDGALQVREAESAGEALEMLNSLAALHQQAWEKRGDPGAFANDHFRRFHRELVGSRFGKGEIQILRVFNDKMTIGYLYNFIFKKHVLFYQSGLNYENANIYRPGLVAHYYAVLHNAQKGMDVYDFLAGNDDYKKSLSTDSRPMQWSRLVKGKRRLFLEQMAAGLRRRADQSNKRSVKELGK